MVVCYVRLYSSLDAGVVQTSRIYALLLPASNAANVWAELAVKPSPLNGFGIHPARSRMLDWSDVGTVPVLLPYLGVETVIADVHALKILLAVLKGRFQQLTLRDVYARHRGVYLGLPSAVVGAKRKGTPNGGLQGGRKV